MDTNVFVCGIEILPPTTGRNYRPVPARAESVIPFDSFSIGGAGPSAADSVNLSSGELDNSPGPDLAVRNPLGPSVVYQRMYRSSRAIQGYASPGLSPGWVDNCDLQIQAPTTVGTWGTLTLLYPNGGSELLTPDVDPNTGNLRSNAIHPPSGAPYLVSGVPSTTVGQWNAITLTFKDEATWTFAPNPNQANAYRLSRIANLLNQGVVNPDDQRPGDPRVFAASLHQPPTAWQCFAPAV